MPLLAVLVFLLPTGQPASAAADKGLELVRTITVPGAVSAKVIEEAGKPRWLYVSSATSFLIYDISDAAAPREVGRLPLPTYQNEDLDGSSSLALLSTDVPLSAPGSPLGGQLVVVSTVDKARPVPVAHISLPDGAGHTTTCLLQCRWIYATGGATLVAVDLRDLARPTVHRIPLPASSGLLHDVDVDDQGLLWLTGDKGLVSVAISRLTSFGPAIAARTARATPLTPVVLSTTGAAGSSPAVARGTLHGSLRPRAISYTRTSGFLAGDVLLAAEEIATEKCRDGGRFHTFDARGLRTGQPLRLLDSVAPLTDVTASLGKGPGAGCSVHWFTQQRQLVAAAWFGAGVRILDVSDPRHVRQIGRYVPVEPRTWSAYWIRDTPYVYALDLHRGLDVLRVTARQGDPEVAALSHDMTGVSRQVRPSDLALCRV